MNAGQPSNAQMPPFAQEVQLNNIFDSLSEGFKRIERLNDAKQQQLLKEMTAQMQEAKT